MARTCEICGKKPSVGNNVTKVAATPWASKKSFSKGKRTNARSTYFSKKRVRANVNGRTKIMRVCTKCLKAGKVVKAG
ncbi:MAG: L28 family ribosomal protein [Acidobacteriota bacterium]